MKKLIRVLLAVALLLTVCSQGAAQVTAAATTEAAGNILCSDSGYGYLYPYPVTLSNGEVRYGFCDDSGRRIYFFDDDDPGDGDSCGVCVQEKEQVYC